MSLVKVRGIFHIGPHRPMSLQSLWRMASAMPEDMRILSNRFWVMPLLQLVQNYRHMEQVQSPDLVDNAPCYEFEC